MSMNILMTSWVAGYLPHPQYQALLCSSGSKGYSAFRRSLEPGYPEHTILLTNVDLLELQQEKIKEGNTDFNYDATTNGIVVGSCPSVGAITGAAYSFIIRGASSGGGAMYPTLNTIHTHLLKNHTHSAPVSNLREPTQSLLSQCSTLSTIDLSGLGNMRAFPSFFLSGCGGLTSVDISSIPTSIITSIQGYFLASCVKLQKTIDFIGLENVTSLGPFFLSSCTGLTHLDFTPLHNVTELSPYFLHRCSGLTRINFTGLENIKVIMPFFLSECTGLTAIDSAPFNNVVELSDYYLRGCSGFKTVDFSGLENVTKIGAKILFGCRCLNSIDMAPLANVKVIPLKFLVETPGIKTIDNPPPLCTTPPVGWEMKDPTQWTKKPRVPAM